MTDYQHPGKTSTGQYYAEPTFKLLDVMKQKHRRKLSPRSLTFSWQCTSAQVTGCSASLCDCKFVQLNHSTYSPDLAPSDHLLTRNLASTIFVEPGSQMTKSPTIVVEAWRESQNKKIIFSGDKQLRRNVEKNALMLQENMSKNDSIYDIICSFLIAKLQNFLIAPRI